MSNLTGNLIKLTPAMALLGIKRDIYPLIYRTIVAHILTAARLTITSSNVISRLNTQAQFELMLYTRLLHDYL